MKKTKEMLPGGFYLLKGESSANSSFVEDKIDAMKFLEECTNRLKGFAKIHDFLITKDGWMLVISLLDEEMIKANYTEKWKQSNRVKKECFLEVVWKIISEQVRQIIFTYVLFSNKRNKREGSKVKRSYERYWFESEKEAEDHLEKMRKQLIRMEQRRKTYRSKKRHFRISKSEAKGAIFLCSQRVGKIEESALFAESCMELLRDKQDVVRNLVSLTKYLHLPRSSSNFTPKIE